MSGNAEVNRVYGLDLIRGVCALAVCLYHVFLWSGSAELHTLGTYAVYIFFVVSGASLYIGYADRPFDPSGLRRFFVRRFLRLAPLYVAVVLFWLLLAWMLDKNVPGIWTLLLNVSLLFGFANPGESAIVTGGWSIGIEVVFYVLFPFVLPLVKSRFWLVLLAVAFVLQHAYIHYVLDTATDLGPVWEAYTQPVSFVFYFLAGLCVARAWKHGQLPRTSWSWLHVALLLAVLFTIPFATYKSALSGPTGWMLSLIAVLVAAASVALHLGTRGTTLAELLGNASYGLYLIHPFVYGALIHLAPPFVSYPIVLALCTALLSGALALAVDRFFEKPVRTWLESVLLGRSGHIRKARRQARESGLWVPSCPSCHVDDKANAVLGSEPHRDLPK